MKLEFPFVAITLVEAAPATPEMDPVGQSHHQEEDTGHENGTRSHFLHPVTAQPAEDVETGYVGHKMY